MNAKWLAGLVLGCTGAQHGTRIETAGAPARGAVLASATTSERGGLRVLWNGRVRGRDFEQRGFAAGNRAEFADLWTEVGPFAAQPALDLSTFSVFAFAGQGSECPREVLAVEVEPRDVLRVRTANDTFICTDLAVRQAVVLAVPRRLLGARVTIAVEHDLAFSFRVPSPGEPLARVEPARAPAQSHAGEQVEVPERGHIALRRLSDGMELWVAHQGDGTLNVLA